MNTEVAYVKGRMVEYLNTIFNTSVRFPPPGPNAAHGLFQLEFRQFAHFGSHASIEFQNTDAKLLHETYQNLVDSTNICFASIDLNEGTAIDPIKISMGLITDTVLILNDLFTILGGDDSAKKQAAEDLGKNLGDLLQQIREGNVIRGTHANGWVSVAIHNKCPAMKSTINDILLVAPKDPDIIKIKEALNLFYDRLVQLETGNHKPWLTGNWQVQFSAICLALAKALEAMV